MVAVQIRDLIVLKDYPCLEVKLTYVCLPVDWDLLVIGF